MPEIFKSKFKIKYQIVYFLIFDSFEKHQWYFSIVKNLNFFVFILFCLRNIIKITEINKPYFKIKLLNEVK